MNGRLPKLQRIPLQEGAARQHPRRRQALCGHPTPCGCSLVTRAYGVQCCVRCPLSTCLFDVNLGDLEARARYVEMERLRESGSTIREIEEVVGRGRRSIFRGLAQRRKEQHGRETGTTASSEREPA